MVRAEVRPSRLAAAAHAVWIVAAVYFARGLVLPLALAALLSLLLLPLVKGVERLRIGRIPSILVVALSAFLLIGAFSWLTIRQVSDLGRKLPKYKVSIIAKAGSLGPLGRIIREAQAALVEVGDEISASVPESGRPSAATQVEVVPSPAKPLDLISRVFMSGIDTLGTLSFVLLLVVFFLIYHVDLKNRLAHMVGDSRVDVTTRTVTEAVHSVSHYLFLQAAMNAGFGILVVLGLWTLGLPHALFFGMLAALFRFIPYVGTWVAALLPFLLSVAVSDGWAQPLAILGGWFMLDMMIANVMEPWVYGSRTVLSPLAVVLSAFFWTWMWGVSGLLLAIPLTVSLVVLGKHLPPFAFLQTLLGSEGLLDSGLQFYRRLLEPDQQPTVDLVDRCQEEVPPREVYDSLLLPALCRAESDRQEGRLEPERETILLGNLRDLIQDLGERHEARGAPESEGPTAPSFVPGIVLLPAARPADAVAASMLSQLLHGRGWRLDTAPETADAGEKVDFVAASKAHVVVISAVPPSSLIQVRYLFKRIRRLHPNVAIVVGLWNSQGHSEILRKRIAPDSDAHVVTTLAEAVHQIRQICQPLIPAHAGPDSRLLPVPV